MSHPEKNSARLHHESTVGPGRPLLLIHPIGASLRFWDALVPALSGKKHLVRVDLRGHGQSLVSPGEYTLAQLADDVIAFADGHGMDSFDLCGVSLGGMVALAVAAQVPSRVNGVIVCSSASRVAGPPGGWDGRREQALTGGMLPLAGPMVDRMFSSAFRASEHPMIKVLRGEFERMDAVGYAGACAILRDADLTATLPQVQAPTLVVSGTLDALCPPEKGKALADGLPHASHVAIECGHFPPVERPEAFAALVLEHCAG